MKILVTPHSYGVGPGEPSDVVIKDLERTFPKLEFVWCETLDEELDAIVDAEVYSGWPSRKVFNAATNLKWIHCPGAGINELTDIPELVNSDIPVTNARNPHVSPMATHVFGFIIIFAHRFHQMIEEQKSKTWNTGDYAWKQIDLEGQTLGIFGFGNIGKRIAKRALGFDMDVYAVDKYPKPSEYTKEVWGLENLHELLEISDWLVVTAPITEETRGMIGREELQIMKPTSHLIVISRGGIVDETALFEAVRSRNIAGAGLDAMEPEPPVSGSPLWDTPNIIISPHASAYTPSVIIGRRETFKENLRRYVNNEPFLYVCDIKAGF